MGENMVIEERKEIKERRILDRKPKEIPGMEKEEKEKEKNRKTTSEILAGWDKEDELEDKLEGELDKKMVKKLRREKRLKEFTEAKERREALAAETDYGWCDELELPTIEVTFDENEDITAERTNRKVIK